MSNDAPHVRKVPRRESAVIMADLTALKTISVQNNCVRDEMPDAR